ncbi:anti-sigma factor family protein [Paenibacillus sacheonensis]|uniref:Putative zinc-finger domain-containing protein n=1 Tax=Paenibacillus sacheonensis TaxID=742054 RepID=A0A7X4YNC1_9BACL|nr:anti-sigma factor [Paenibacillus sacheonensis]MBM7565609.1 hypothetical protein [Paenibacillus sacheonensis]NBC69473.1 hypothetical protein [Paenibacillus sacheonensis]
MNCQEVMEYMQRQLDGDLDEQETAILMNHTRHCSDCAAMFERLKLLSAGLESLPKVTPGYSLVDAILPKLAELQTASELTIPQPHIVIAGEEKAAPRRAKPAGNWRRWLPISAAGGVVAAGVILGMFFLNGQGMHTLRDSGNMAADADTAATGSSNSAADMSDNASDTSPASNSGENKKDSSFVRSQGTKNDAAQNNSVEMSKELNVDPNGEPMPPITGGEHDRITTDENSNSPNQSYDTADSGDAGDAAAQDGASDQAPAAGGNAKGGGTTDGADKAAGQSGNSGAGSGNTLKQAESPVPTLMASPISPDEQFQAFIVEDKVLVYTVSDSVAVFEGKKRSGIADLKWSDDSKLLTYTAAQADGSKITYVVDPAAGTEQVQSSK